MARTRRSNHEGTIVKKVRNGVVRYEWRQMIDGQTRTVTAATAANLQDKLKEVKDLPIDKTKTTVTAWSTKWLSTYVAPLNKKATYDQYKYVVDCFVVPQIGKRKISTIKQSDIQSVIAEANKTGKSSWTMKHIRKVMRLLFAQAIKDKLINTNPVVEIKVPVIQAKGKKVLNVDELSKIINRLKKSRWRAAIDFELATGLRRGELLALKWSDIDFVNGLICIDESLSRDGIAGDTKSSKIHYVPLTHKASKALNDQREILKREGNPQFFSTKQGLIFPNKYGEALHPGSFYTMIARAAKAEGIKASPHMFRHTFVYLNRKDIPLKDLQEILGHSSSTTTLDIYGDILSENFAETATYINSAMDKLDEELSKALKKPDKTKVVKFPKNKNYG